MQNMFQYVCAYWLEKLLDSNFLFTVIDLHEYKDDYIQQYKFWLTKSISKPIGESPSHFTIQ